MLNYVLNDNGDPVEEPDILIWGRWLGDADRRVKEDVIERDGNEIRVSTVFMGLDHSFAGGTPVLWETMIFGGEHDEYQERYTSRKDALVGHEKALELAGSES